MMKNLIAITCFVVALVVGKKRTQGVRFTSQTKTLITKNI